MIDWTVSQMWAMDDIFNIWTFITWMFWTLIYHPIWSPVRRAIKFEKRLQIDYEVDLAVDLDFELYIYIYGPLLLHVFDGRFDLDHGETNVAPFCGPFFRFWSNVCSHLGSSSNSHFKLVHNYIRSHFGLSGGLH